MDPEDKTVTFQILGSEKYTLKPNPLELCRLCANTDNQLIPIFKGEGLEHDIPSKLEKHLPIIKVTETDKLPLQICYQCASTLIAWHNFYEGSSVADKRLREILAVDEKYQDAGTYEDFGEDFRDDDFDQSHIDLVESIPLNTTSTSSQHEELSQNESASEITQLKNSKILNETARENTTDERKFEAFCITEEYESLIDEFFDHETKVITFDSLRDALYCKFCNVNFETVNCFNDHSCVNMMAEDTCTCNTCKKTFNSKNKLVSHIHSMHTVLSKTNIQLPRLLDGKLQNDQFSRLPNGKFQCLMCDKIFCRKLNLSQHVMTHVAEKNVCCDLCDFKCYTKTQLDVHKMKHAKRFCCEICSKMFTYKFQLETHVQAVHYNLRPFKCSLCNKSFKTRYNYGSHIAQHKDVRNFQCPYCPRKCRKSYDLRVHIRTHTGERPFQCSFCQRCYSQNGDRMKHEKHCYAKGHSATEILVERYPDNDITDAVPKRGETLIIDPMDIIN